MRIRLAHLSLLALLLILFLPLGVQAREARPQVPYNCGTNLGLVFGSHCYGLISQRASQQNGAPAAYYGATTTVDIVQMGVASTAGGATNGLIDNEIWFSDDAEPPGVCQAFPFVNTSCWIEVGYAYANYILQGQFYPHLSFFWADVRPHGDPALYSCVAGCGLQVHAGPSIGQYIGRRAVLQIQRLGATSQTWSVQATIIGGGPSLYGQSTHNSMTGNLVDTGQELAGSGFSGLTATANTARFDNNAFQDQPLGTWIYYTYNATPQGFNPPWAGWKFGFKPSIYRGGLIYTCTKLSSGQNPC